MFSQNTLAQLVEAHIVPIAHPILGDCEIY